MASYDSNMANKFQKIACIGRGTFGEAWLVTSVCSHRKYVIKEIILEKMNDAELEKVRTEARILARCKHNNIIRYKDHFMKEGPMTMCLVMEYADGGDLAAKIGEANTTGSFFSEACVLNWFVQLLFAVQYLHSNDILHRDLKTRNLFLTTTNLIKVGDFGIARFLRNKQDLATTAIGTPYYLSPEICRRMPYNHKSDMWAVGCILYELCALTHPFYALNFEDLVIKILRGGFNTLSHGYSVMVHDLVTVLLRTNPARRPSAEQLLNAPGLKFYVESYIKLHEDFINNFKPTVELNNNNIIHPVCAMKKDGSYQPSQTNATSMSRREAIMSEVGMRSRCSSDPTLDTSQARDESINYKKQSGSTAPTPVGKYGFHSTPPRSAVLRDQNFHTPKFSEPLITVKNPLGQPQGEDTKKEKSELEFVSKLENLVTSADQFQSSCYWYKPRTKSTANSDQKGSASDDEECSNRLGILGTTFTIKDRR